MHRHGHRNGSRRRVEGALAVLAAASALGGCSWLYDTGELPAYVPPDAPRPDANPTSVVINTLSAAVELEEGYGDGYVDGEGGSRPAILVLEGTDLTAATTVEITRADGTPIPEVTVGKTVAAYDYTRLAVPVTVTASAALAGEVKIPLRVRAWKEGPDGTVPEAVTTWTLHGRHELDRVGTIIGEGAANPHIYSKVEVTGSLTLAGTEALIMRSNSTFRITGNFSLSANGQTAGVAGGNAGGPGGVAGFGKSGGPGGGGSDGGGGGFATQGSGGPQSALPSGDELIKNFDDNRSSGGGGGGVLMLGLIGGPGGGGGGTIELSARADLTVGNITSSGGNGGAGLLSLGDGGGGSGGVIVLRSATKLSAGTLRAEGGAGGDANPMSNKGSVGRIRIDAPEVVAGLTSPLAKRGAMFDPKMPTIVSAKELSFQLFGSTGSRFDLHLLNADSSPQRGPTVVEFQGATEVKVTVTLQSGYNRICTTPIDSPVSRLESTNCVEVAFIDVDG
jgi:hypothetical protein